MTAALWKLIAAFALVWMPIGMTPASAAAMHSAPAAMADHCAGSDAAPHDKAMHSADCTGCVAVAALPAHVDEPADGPALPAYCAALDLRAGLHAETSTPPPKVA
jgi:hypothetical protein